MAQSVYKLWQGRYTEAWHQLPQEEQQRLLSQVMKALDTAGAKELVICSPLGLTSDGPSSASKNSLIWSPYNATNRS